MKNVKQFCLTILLIGAFTASASAGTRILNKEGVIGATSGAIAGGVIGHQSGNRTEGALIGSVAGYAIGTTIHRQKQREKANQRQLQREMEFAAQREEAYRREAMVESPPPAPVAPVAPRMTNSEQQQLLLQAYPLFSVRSRQ